MVLDWRPSCQLEHLRKRAQMLSSIRAFFDARSVLEVETPLLCRTTGTDPQLDFFSTFLTPHQVPLFLQTSPEFAMKRLLAAGSGSIFQICKAFRNGEHGRLHNPEFTMLEWYRVDFDLFQLMDEVVELIVSLTPDVTWKIRKVSYQSVFLEITGLDPLSFGVEAYQAYASNNGFEEAVALCREDHAVWLDFLFSHVIEPRLENNTIWLIYGYPAIQSSLARLDPEDSRQTERFEILINGMELGNGYHELCDPLEQGLRFDREIVIRQANDLPDVVRDERLLAALESGLPNCSGIAIGLDRLLMILTGQEKIEEVLSFPVEQA